MTSRRHLLPAEDGHGDRGPPPSPPGCPVRGLDGRGGEAGHASTAATARPSQFATFALTQLIYPFAFKIAGSNVLGPWFGALVLLRNGLLLAWGISILRGGLSVPAPRGLYDADFGQ